MKVLECSKCHRMFKSSEERMFIHTKEADFNFCTNCTLKATMLMELNIQEEEKMTLNYECMKCPMKKGCLGICAANPENVQEPPCGKYAIGITGNHKGAFWTRPIEAWKLDRFAPNPQDLLFCVVATDDKTEVKII